MRQTSGLSLAVPPGLGGVAREPPACLYLVCSGPILSWGEARCLAQRGAGDREEAGGSEMDLSWEEARGLALLQGAVGASLCCLGFRSPQLVSEDNKTEASPPWATPPWPQMGCG